MTMETKFSRAIYHLTHGSFLQAVKSNWVTYRQNRCLSWWASRQAIQDFIIKFIQPDIKMKLFFDSELSQLIHCRNFEYEERHFLNHFLKAGDIFIDVGANIGLFTLIAARRVIPGGCVYAFEPTRMVFERLRENIALNRCNNVNVYRWALSDTESQRQLYQSEDGFDAWNSLVKPVKEENYSQETVDCRQLDDVVANDKLIGRVALIKIDVEGWETRVLQGACRTLSRGDAPVLLVEFTDETALSAGSSCRELYQLLESFGYRLYAYDPKCLKIEDDPLRDRYPYSNLIAAKDSQAVNDRLRQ